MHFMFSKYNGVLVGPILHALRTSSDVQWLQRVFAAAPIRDAPSVRRQVAARCRKALSRDGAPRRAWTRQAHSGLL